jgi:hypothetical protein
VEGVLGAGGAGRPLERGTRGARRVRPHRVGEQLGDELVVPGWQGDLQRAGGAQVDLCRPAGAGPAPAAAALEADLEQPGLGELVEVVGGQLPGDADRGGRLGSARLASASSRRSRSRRSMVDTLK